jgi:hypothetical protein
MATLRSPASRRPVGAHQRDQRRPDSSGAITALWLVTNNTHPRPLLDAIKSSRHHSRRHTLSVVATLSCPASRRPVDAHQRGQRRPGSGAITGLGIVTNNTHSRFSLEAIKSGRHHSRRYTLGVVATLRSPASRRPVERPRTRSAAARQQRRNHRSRARRKQHATAIRTQVARERAAPPQTGSVAIAKPP